MKNNVIVLTGACGVGKSTLSRLWAKSNSGVSIECDYFTEWIYDQHPITTDYFLKVEKMIVDLAWSNTQQYLSNGFSVAIENVWSPAGLIKLREYLKINPLVNKMTFIYLKCDLNQNMNRDLSRPSHNQMNERVEIVRNELEDHIWPDFVHVVDNSTLSIQETLDLINSL